MGEYEKETKLAFEKEVLGVYLSGHPMEEYEEKWRKSISKTTLDFQLVEDTGHTKVLDGAREIIGGMITDKTIKYTKNNKVMAFVTLEDMLGSVEVVVFPKDYEKNQQYLNEDSKVFIKGSCLLYTSDRSESVPCIHTPHSGAYGYERWMHGKNP